MKINAYITWMHVSNLKQVISFVFIKLREKILVILSGESLFIRMAKWFIS